MFGKPLWDVIAWFLPIFGMVVVLGLAAILPGAARRMTLAIGPFLVGWAMWYVGPTIKNGSNWLADIGRMLLYGAGYLVIAVHYAVLLPAAIAGWAQRNERLRQEQRGEGPLPPEEAGRRMAELFASKD